jgi:hypothetical protein
MNIEKLTVKSCVFSAAIAALATGAGSAHAQEFFFPRIFQQVRPFYQQNIRPYTNPGSFPRPFQRYYIPPDYRCLGCGRGIIVRQPMPGWRG